MPNTTMEPKKILFVLTDDRIRTQIDNEIFYHGLMRAGHEIVGVFYDYEQAHQFVLDNPYAADTMVATTHYDKGQVPLFEAFDRMLVTDDMNDRHTRSSRTIITLGEASTMFTDSRYQTDAKSLEYAAYVYYELDVSQRSPVRMQDELINPFNHTPEAFLNSIVDTINQTVRGRYLEKKREEIRAIVAEKDAKGNPERRNANDTPALR